MLWGEVGRRSCQECCPTTSSYQIDAAIDEVVTFHSHYYTPAGLVFIQ